MTEKKKNVRKNNYILPAAAVILAAAALITIFVLPKKSDQAVVSDPDAGLIRISAADLSSDNVTFIRLDGSRIELLARKDDSGTVRVALGTCQSCNGSPGAYYTQEGDLLRCNNCGLTFPLSVLDQPGGGCHPIMIDEDMILAEDDGISIDTEKLMAYEYLFAKVKAH